MQGQGNKRRRTTIHEQCKHRLSAYAKRQCKLAGRIVLASGVYEPDFRAIVKEALDCHQRGERSELPRLIREADEIYRERQEFSKEIFARMNADLKERQSVREKADRIEALISGPRIEGKESLRSTNRALKYAVQALLIELSNESRIGVDEPGIAGIFYAMAVSELKDSAGETKQRCLRHLDILLSNPTHKAVKAITKYWDDGRTDVIDPFPAHPDDNAHRQTSEEADELDDSQPDNPTLISLREKLAKLERLPENEAIQFQLESEIYQLERETDADTKWPDVIGGAL